MINITKNQLTLIVVIIFMIGVIWGMMLYYILPGTLLTQAERAIVECEKTLPRNEHCVVTATRKGNEIE